MALEGRDLAAAAEAAGLTLRGGFSLNDDERSGPLAGRGAVVLLGFVGAGQWPAFAASSEAKDGLADPLDRWSRRVVGDLARRFGATALFPFDGPPYWPFQRWAQRAEPVAPSPLGLLIHPRYGLWHSYRGALALSQPWDATPAAADASPCISCATRPCLSACPVSAFSHEGYDVAVCFGFLEGEAGSECKQGGCLARRSCPVGRDYAQAAEQARFHIAAFRTAQRGNSTAASGEDAGQ